MKKIIFLAMALLVAAAVNAQINFGIKGGGNLSNIIKTNDKNFNTSFKAGFNAGVLLDIHLVGPLSFQPEVLYSTKGYSAQTTYGVFDQRTNFIDAPLLAKIKLAPGFSVVVGPQISFLLDTKNTYDNGFTTVVQQQFENDKDKFKKSLIDGVIGFTAAASKNIDIEFRYTLDLQQNNQDGTSQTPQYRNQVFQLGLAFKAF
ncbi:PorT family protein [Mucilaginibacter sp. HMF5004]|uniref:porin family protein n=1 Tax=Mucilaginibacter rivuli TaxID=2857527 RepID=UPI001C5F2ED1|nr:porin family protein [Mucilaginibacter rivuli]MBW4888330.1 PorT family protein [Mucilaginibacter rivuli]